MSPIDMEQHTTVCIPTHRSCISHGTTVSVCGDVTADTTAVRFACSLWRREIESVTMRDVWTTAHIGIGLERRSWHGCRQLYQIASSSHGVSRTQCESISAWQTGFSVVLHHGSARPHLAPARSMQPPIVALCSLSVSSGPSYFAFLFASPISISKSANLFSRLSFSRVSRAYSVDSPSACRLRASTSFSAAARSAASFLFCSFSRVSSASSSSPPVAASETSAAASSPAGFPPSAASLRSVLSCALSSSFS
mmetsp:Transcript_28329/g.64160  ORF Transcript_28329/g.64160 Transcript_28329/m.64160 type:complete len:252 (+) Transcript_28329:164-919(+)